MTKNTTNLSLEEAKKQFCKTASIFALLLFCVTPSPSVRANDHAKTVESKVEKITLSGDHINGDFVVLSYTDLKQKKRVPDRDAALSLLSRPNFQAIEARPVNLGAWQEEGDKLVCTPSANKKCAIAIRRNEQTISLPDACGNYSLLEAWDRYDMLMDGIELDNPALVEAFQQAEICFLTMRKACGATSSSICNM